MVSNVLRQSTMAFGIGKGEIEGLGGQRRDRLLDRQPTAVCTPVLIETPGAMHTSEMHGQTHWRILQGFLPIEKSRIPAEVMAGVTLAALGIPEVMGYTRIIGTPVVTGLYTMLLPMLVFACLGSSRHLVVSADSATAAMVAAALAS